MTPTILIILLILSPVAPYKKSKSKLSKTDKDLLEFALNLEYLEAEFFLYGSMGKGLDTIQPNLTGGGPPPVGVRIAKLTPLIRSIISQFGLQEVGHIRAIKKVVPGFPRPLLNLSVRSFARAINKAFGRPLFPPFDPYANDINYLLSSYIIPYVGLTAYVGANSKLQSKTAKKLVGGALGVESGQDAVLRTLLYERSKSRVIPYGITVGEFTDRISNLRNKLGGAGLKDNGLSGASLLVGDTNSLTYARTPHEVLRIIYATGNEHIPGGFYPQGANGTIARKYLHYTT